MAALCATAGLRYGVSPGGAMIKTRSKCLLVNAILLVVVLKHYACHSKGIYVEIYADRTRFQVLTVRGLYSQRAAVA